jgi:serine/threonine-protein kinase
VADGDRASDPHVGRVLDGRYRVLRLIAKGGMGSIYEAEHEAIGQRVALKVMHTALTGDDGVLSRFANEARAAAMLGHPGIIKCIDVGDTDDGTPYLVLELLEGRDLEAELRARGALPIHEAISIAIEVAAAVGCAHRAGIIHRDLKPDNVFLLARPEPTASLKVLDFGISKFTNGLSAAPPTKTGTVLGTPNYMAPEQIHDSSKADARADVYGLGALLYQMLAGKMAFEAPALPTLVMKILSSRPPPLAEIRPELPAPLIAAVERALAKLPEERFASMDELMDAIRPYARPAVRVDDVGPIAPSGGRGGISIAAIVGVFAVVAVIALLVVLIM